MNHIKLTGKISRVGQLKYTPSGLPLLEFTLAVPQVAYGKETVGYHEVVVTGSEAEEIRQKLKIGIEILVEGQLFQRNFRNRAGNRVSETKIILGKVGGKNETIR